MFPRSIHRLSALLALAFGAALAAPLAGCRRCALPDDCESLSGTPVIFPDYTSLTIPPNIAPMNFQIEEEGERFLTEIAGENGEKTLLEGKCVEIGAKFWRKLLEANTGKKIFFSVYVCRDGAWRRYSPVENSVSPDRIDPFLSYRSIEPGYIFSDRVRLVERSLESFDTRTFFDSTALAGGCANCHTAQRNDPKRSLFHYRHKDNGGTMIFWDGRVKKVANTARSGFVLGYASWHPTLPVFISSTNSFQQIFHSFDTKRIEVFDSFADLVLYDAENQTLKPVIESDGLFETFPAWRGDGSEVYFCRARLKTSEDPKLSRKEARNARLGEMTARYREIHFSLMKMSFDPQKRRFGSPQTVFDAGDQYSYLYPVSSPDGRFLVYVRQDYGTMPIYHKESDLWLLDLETGANRPMSEINSDDVDGFHGWDSSGRWMLFSTRREDGIFTRTYFTHFGPDGTCTKPFPLPMATAEKARQDRFAQSLPKMLTGPLPAAGGKMNWKMRHAKPEPTKLLDP